jgi:hypothetical protein
MATATFWFASPFRDWIGRRTVTVDWDGRLTLRDVVLRLAAAHPEVRRHIPPERLTDDAWNHLAAVLLRGDFLSLDSEIPDGAQVDVLLPLTGGIALAGC